MRLSFRRAKGESIGGGGWPGNGFQQGGQVAQVSNCHADARKPRRRLHPSAWVIGPGRRQPAARGIRQLDDPVDLSALAPRAEHLQCLAEEGMR